MAGFNLTAQLNLRGPSNVRQIVSDIKKQLGTITGDINLKVNATATKNITQLNSVLSTLNTNLSQVSTNATSASNAISAFASAANSINKATSSTSSNINKTVASTNKLVQSQATASKAISTSSSEMQEFGKQSALAVRRFAAFSGATGVILGLGGAIRKGLSEFIEYEKEFVKIQQVTDKTASQLTGLDQEIRKLSVGLGVSSSELIRVSSTLAQAGLSAKEAQQALQALALTDLAPSFDSLNETVEGSIALMRQFSIGAGELEKALGSVNAVSAAFAVESSDLIAAIQRTGGVFASASRGVSEGTQALNEFLAIFTSVRQTTRESAETIATGLRTIFTRIQRADTIEALREYGVNLTDLEGKFVGAYKGVELLSKGLNSIDPRDLRFSQIVEELGGFRQIGKVIPLIQQFGVAQQALGVAQRGQGSLAKDALTAQLSLANQISKVREEFLALMRSVGNGDAFQTIARSALGFTSVLLKVADSIKGLLPILAIVGIGKLSKGIGEFGTGFVGGLFKGNKGGDGGGNAPTNPGGIPPILGGGGNATPGNLAQNLSLLDDILIQNTDAINNLGTSLSGLTTSLGSISAFSTAIQANTSSLTSNTTSIQALTAAVAGLSLGGGAPGAPFNLGGTVKKFARGGVVPGSGNGDTVPAMLMPGEFVIRKKAVETIGAENLHGMNKYGGGGSIRGGRAGKRKRFIEGGAAWSDDMEVGKDLDINKKAGPRVTDGDTFAAQVFTVKEYRLDGVDAAEKSQPFGDKASELLSSSSNSLIDNIEKGGSGAYGRGLFRNDELASSLVQQGYAIPDLRYSKKGQFNDDLKSAQQSKSGIWSIPNHPKRFLYNAMEIIKPKKRVQELAGDIEQEYLKKTYGDLRKKAARSAIAQSKEWRPRGRYNSGGMVQKFMAGGNVDTPKLIQRGTLSYSLEDILKAGLTEEQFLEKIPVPPPLMAINPKPGEYGTQFKIGGVGAGSVPMPKFLTPYSPPDTAAFQSSQDAVFKRSEASAEYRKRKGLASRDYEGKSSTEKSFLAARDRGYNWGGMVQKFMAGGKTEPAPFGTGATKFPKRITNAYVKEMHKKLNDEQVSLAWDQYPKDERINIDQGAVAEQFNSQAFDRKKFESLFKTKIRRNDLVGDLANFAKYIGLPEQDLSKVLPQSIDFGGVGQNVGARGTFYANPYGARDFDKLDLSQYGFSEADEQDLFGYEKLFQEKEKEIKKIMKTPTKTFDDGSFSIDDAAFKRAYDEKTGIHTQISKVKDKRAYARKAAMAAKKEITDTTGRGTVGLSSTRFAPNQEKNTLYHELTHQLLNSIRTQSSGAFDKYKDRVTQLFSGDNDGLADAFDALTEKDGGYNSADIVYGRSYKNKMLDSVLGNLRRDTIRTGRSDNPEVLKDGSALYFEAEKKKNAREYRPINPKITDLLLKGGVGQDVVNKAEDHGKEEFLTTLIQKRPTLDSNMEGILDSTLNELLGNAGIQRQQYAEGGKAQRNIGIIDTDVLRDPANADIVGPAMEKLGITNTSLYSIELGKLAAQARKDESLSRLTAIAGAAGSGKSSLATGKGASDDASLRKTVRSSILTPEDISKVNEVIVLTSTTSQEKLDAYLKDVDRAYVLSSNERSEQDRVGSNRQSRDNTGEGLYGRRPGTTNSASRDFALEESVLRDELGDKAMVLGRKPDSFGLRRKKEDELPEIVQAGGYYTGGFAPPTRGHRGAFDTLLSNMISRNPNASAEDIIVSVAPNLSMDRGEGDTDAEKLAHAARYGIFPADFRTLLAGINFPKGMISASAESTGRGDVLPKMMEVQGIDGRRKFAKLKGALAITSGKKAGALDKYEKAGVDVTDIPRIEDISATKVRQAVIDGDDKALTSFVSPEVASVLMGNRPQLRNRSMMVPMLIEEITKYGATQKAQTNAEIQQLLANAPGGPYGKITKTARKNAPDVVAQVEAMREQRDALSSSLLGYRAHNIISLLSAKYPDAYGLDPSRRASVSVPPSDLTKDAISAQLSESMSGEFGGLSTAMPSSGLQEAILKNVEKSTQVKKSSGILPAQGSEILKRFGDERLPTDGSFGPFSGKTVRDTADGGKLKYWNSAFRPETKADKLAYYTATRDYLIDKFNQSQGTKSAQALSDTTSAVLSSQQLGLVGLNPLGYTGLLGPETWNLGTDPSGQERSIDASIVQRGLPTQYKSVIDYLSGQTEEIVGGASKLLGIEPKKLSKKQRETLGQGNIEGALLEQIFGSAGADILDDALRTRPIDFPMGIGPKAASIFGIDPDIPTEVKRTIDSGSRGKAVEEFQRYFRQQYGIPDPEKAVQKLAAGGQVDPLLDKYKTIIASIMPSEYIGKDGFLMTPGGESYEVDIKRKGLFSLINLLSGGKGAITKGTNETRLAILRRNKDKFSSTDYLELSEKIRKDIPVESAAIELGSRASSFLPHESFHTIQNFLLQNYPDLYDRLTSVTLSKRKQFTEIYKKSPIQKEVHYPLESLVFDKSKDSSISRFHKTGEDFAKISPKLAKLSPEYLVQLGADEIIPSLLDMSTKYKDIEAQNLLSNIFEEAGLRSDFMTQKFFFGGKVDPLAKKYGLNQAEFLDQQKIAKFMGLDSSQFEEKLSLFSSQKKRLKSKKFSAIDAVADTSVAGQQVIDQQKALEEYLKQNKFASGGSVKLYHGSNSGPDDSVLKNFKENGILSSMASGYGQGSGFFMWSDRESAMSHAKTLIDPNSNMTTSAKTGGRPMVVEATEVLNPKNWDLDYELQSKNVVDYIYANFDNLKPLLEKSQGVDLGDNLKNFQLRNKIDEYVDPNDNTTMRKVQIGFDDENKEVRRTLANTTGDLRTGQVIGKLVQALRMGDPDVLDSFESDFFSNLQPGTALKYVGSSPLKPSNIETFAYGGRAGISSKDTVPALLTPGEFVINKESAQNIGYARLAELNRADKIQGYNSGGFVRRYAGGTGGGGVPGGGPGGGGGPSPMDPAARKAADALAYFSLQAEYYGTTLSKYRDNLKDQIINRTLEIRAQVPQNINRFRARSFELRNDIQVGSAAGATDRDQAKASNAQDELSQLIKQITGSTDDAKIQSAMQEFIGNINDTSQSFDDVINTSNELKGIFSEASTVSAQYARVIKEFSLTTGVAEIELRKIAKLRNVKAEEAFNKLSESANKFAGRITAVSLSVAAFGGFISSIIDANDDRFSKSAAAAISGAANTGGKIATFGGQVVQNTASLGKVGGVVGGVARSALKFMMDPVTLGVAAAGVALVSFAAAVKDAKNAAREFDIAKAQKNVESSLLKVSNYFKDFEQNMQNIDLLTLIQQQLVQSVTNALGKIRLESEVPKTFWVNLGDTLFQDKAAAAESSRVLEKRGIFAYLETQEGIIERYFGGSNRAAKAREKYTNLDAEEVASKRSQDLQPIVNEIIRLGQARIKSGASLQDVMADLGPSGSPTQTAELLARANPEIEEQIIRIKASNDLSNIEKSKRIQNIISIEAEYKARLAYEQAIKTVELEKLAKETKVFTTSIQRMLNIMDQAIGKTSFQLEKMNSSLILSNDSLSGSAKAGDAMLKAVNVLQNPRVYSAEDQKSARTQGSAMFGPASDVIYKLLNISNNIEDTVFKTINDTIANRDDASPEAISGAIRASMNIALNNLGLPPELADKLSNQVKNSFNELKSGEDKKLSFSELVEKIPAFAETIESAKAAQVSAIKALEAWQQQLTNYTKTMNQGMEYQLEANDRIRKISEINIKSEEDLNKTLGKPTNLTNQRSNINATTASLTGGLVDPNDIFNKILRLEEERRVQQNSVNNAQEGGPENVDAINKMTRNLNMNNLALRENYRALKNMAETSELASAALSKMSEVQQKNQAGQTIIEKLVTSNAVDIDKFNRSLGMLNNNMAGGVNNSTPDDRSQVLQTFNMIAPLLGSQQNSLKANVLESLLKESGVGINAMFANVITSLRAPEADSGMVEALKVYKSAIEQQKLATEGLSALSEIMANNTYEQAGKSLGESIQPKLDAQTAYLHDISLGINTLVTIAEGSPAKPKASGGMVYADSGMFVDFKPKGTDTVPAMLTPGEFVVNRQATQKNLPLLKNINSGNTSYYARGGIVLDDRWSNSSFGKTPSDQLKSIEKFKNTNDLVTEQALFEMDDPIKASNLRANRQVYTAPSTYFAVQNTDPEGWWTDLYNGGFSGDGYYKAEYNKPYLLGNVDAVAGIGYEAVGNNILGTTILPPRPNLSPSSLMGLGKPMFRRSDFDGIINLAIPTYKQIKKDEVLSYRLAYENLEKELESSSDIQAKIEGAEPLSRELINASTALKQSAQFKQIRSAGGRGSRIEGLTYTSPKQTYAHLVDENSAWLPTNKPAGLIGFNKGKISKGTDLFTDDYYNLSRNVLPFASTQTNPIKTDINSFSEIFGRAKYGSQILNDKNLTFMESKQSIMNKSAVGKLEDLYDNKVSKVSLGSEVLTEFSKIKLPVTLYNMDNVKWDHYIDGLVKGGILSPKDIDLTDPDSEKLASKGLENYIKLAEMDDKANVVTSTEKRFPWTSASFENQQGIEDKFGEEFKKTITNPFKVTDGNYTSDKFRIDYSKIKGPLFNEAVGDFEDAESTYFAVKSSLQNEEYNPLKEVGGTWYFKDIQNLIKTLEDSTPSYDVASGKHTNVKPPLKPYTYDFDGIDNGLITKNNNIKELLKNNQVYHEYSEIQDFVVGMDNATNQKKYLAPYQIISMKYKDAREKRIQDSQNTQTRQALSRVVDSGIEAQLNSAGKLDQNEFSDIFNVKTSLTEDEKKAGLNNDDLESFDAAKRVTLARYLYDNAFVKSLNITSNKPTSLNSIAKIADELDSRLPEISKANGGTGSRAWNEINAIRAFFTSLEEPSPTDPSYFKRLGFPLRNKDYIKRIPPPKDPANPDRTPIDYYDKINNKYDISSLMHRLIVRETEYQMAASSISGANRLRLTDAQKTNMSSDIGGWSLSQIDSTTGNIIDQKDKAKIETYADIETIALNPYNAPSSSSSRQKLLNDLSYFYKNDQNDIGENIFNPNRAKFIEGSDSKPLFGDTKVLTAKNMEDSLSSIDSLMDWYSIQDNIINKSKTPQDISFQTEELAKFGQPRFSTLRDYSQAFSTFLTGNLYGLLPDFNYLMSKLKSISGPASNPQANPANPTTLNKGGVVYASTGKYIDFKPKGTDTVPAMLTPGEFVVNREATQKNLPLLQQMNDGGKVIYRAKGSDQPEYGRSWMSNLHDYVFGSPKPPSRADGYARDAERRRRQASADAWTKAPPDPVFGSPTPKPPSRADGYARDAERRRRQASADAWTKAPPDPVFGSPTPKPPSRADGYARDAERRRRQASADAWTKAPPDPVFGSPTPKPPKRGQASVYIPPEDRKPISIQTDKSPISPPKPSESAQAEPIKPVGSIIVSGRSSIPSQTPPVTLTPADVTKVSVLENKNRVWYGGKKWDINNDGKENETITGNINKILDTQRVMINTNDVVGKLLILRKEYMNAEDLFIVKAFEDQLKEKTNTVKELNRTNDQTVLPKRSTDPVIQQSRTGENYLTVSGTTSSTSALGQPQTLKLDQKDTVAPQQSAIVEDILNKSRTWYDGKLWDINNDGKTEELTVGPISKILKDGKILIMPRKTWTGQPDSNNGLILSPKNLTQKDIDFVNMWKKQKEEKKKANAMSNGGVVYAQDGLMVGENQSFTNQYVPKPNKPLFTRTLNGEMKEAKFDEDDYKESGFGWNDLPPALQNKIVPGIPNEYSIKDYKRGGERPPKINRTMDVKTPQAYEIHPDQKYGKMYEGEPDNVLGIIVQDGIAYRPPEKSSSTLNIPDYREALYTGAKRWFLRNYAGFNDTGRGYYVRGNPQGRMATHRTLSSQIPSGWEQYYKDTMSTMSYDKMQNTQSLMPFQLQETNEPSHNSTSSSPGVAGDSAYIRSGQNTSSFDFFNPSTYVTPGVIALHELEHQRQDEYIFDKDNPELLGPPNVSYDWHKMSIMEPPAVLSEMVYAAQGVKHTRNTAGLTGELKGTAPLTPNYQPSLEWMVQQAKSHGHIGGDKSMTELLNTPEGQAWLKVQWQDLADTPKRDINRVKKPKSGSIPMMPTSEEELRDMARKLQEPPKRKKFLSFFADGGVVYANNGQLVNFQPRGTDTVPAMLTPGEFVINKQATEKHLPLLKQINQGGSGDVIYRASGSTEPEKSKKWWPAMFDFSSTTKPAVVTSKTQLVPVDIDGVSFPPAREADINRRVQRISSAAWMLGRAAEEYAAILAEEQKLESSSITTNPPARRRGAGYGKLQEDRANKQYEIDLAQRMNNSSLNYDEETQMIAFATNAFKDDTKKPLIKSTPAFDPGEFRDLPSSQPKVNNSQVAASAKPKIITPPVHAVALSSDNANTKKIEPLKNKDRVWYGGRLWDINNDGKAQELVQGNINSMWDDNSPTINLADKKLTKNGRLVLDKKHMTKSDLDFLKTWQESHSKKSTPTAPSVRVPENKPSSTTKPPQPRSLPSPAPVAPTAPPARVPENKPSSTTKPPQPRSLPSPAPVAPTAPPARVPENKPSSTTKPPQPRSLPSPAPAAPLTRQEDRLGKELIGYGPESFEPIDTDFGNQPKRTWSDYTNKYALMGRLKALTKDSSVNLNNDTQKFSVKYSRLSNADMRYIDSEKLRISRMNKDDKEWDEIQGKRREAYGDDYVDRNYKFDNLNLRDWTDISGKHTTKAKLVSTFKDSATLQKENDKQVNLPIAKLSKIDSDYIYRMIQAKRRDIKMDKFESEYNAATGNPEWGYNEAGLPVKLGRVQVPDTIGEFQFDPVTGRVMSDGDRTPLNPDGSSVNRRNTLRPRSTFRVENGRIIDTTKRDVQRGGSYVVQKPRTPEQQKQWEQENPGQMALNRENMIKRARVALSANRKRKISTKTSAYYAKELGFDPSITEADLYDKLRAQPNPMQPPGLPVKPNVSSPIVKPPVSAGPTVKPPVSAGKYPKTDGTRTDNLSEATDHSIFTTSDIITLANEQNGMYSIAIQIARYRLAESGIDYQTGLPFKDKQQPVTKQNGGLIYAQYGTYVSPNTGSTLSVGRLNFEEKPKINLQPNRPGIFGDGRMPSAAGTTPIVSGPTPAISTVKPSTPIPTGKKGYTWQNGVVVGPKTPSGLITTSGGNSRGYARDNTIIDPRTLQPKVSGPNDTPMPTTQSIMKDLKSSRVWYGGKLWDQNRDGKESPNEQLIGTLDDVAMDGDVRIIRDKDWGYGKVLRLDPRNFAKYSTSEDKSIVKTWLDLGKKKSPAAIEPSKRFANGGIVYASNGKMIDFKQQGTDTIPAMLTPGEFVVNRESTRKNLPLLQNLNRGNSPVYRQNGSEYPEGDSRIIVSGAETTYQDPSLKRQKARDEKIEEDRRRADNYAWSVANKDYPELSFPVPGNAGMFGALDKYRNTKLRNIIHDRILRSFPYKYDKSDSLMKFRDKDIPTEEEINKEYDDTLKDLPGHTYMAYRDSVNFMEKAKALNNADIENFINSNSGLPPISLPFKNMRPIGAIVSGFSAITDTALATKNLLWAIGGLGLSSSAISKVGITDGDFAYQASMIDFQRAGQGYLTALGQLGGMIDGITGTDNFTKALHKSEKIGWELYGDRVALTLAHSGETGANIFKGSDMVAGTSAALLASIASEAPLKALAHNAEAAVVAARINRSNPNTVSALETVSNSALVLEKTYAITDLAISKPADAVVALESVERALKNQYTEEHHGDHEEKKNYWEDLMPNVRGEPKRAQRYYANGGVIYANNGQLVNFQPKGTDTVPAMLTPGEFVINRASTQKHLPVLQAINSGTYSHGDIVKRFSDGGYLNPNYYRSGSYVSPTVSRKQDSFDFAGFMQKLMGQLSSVISEALREGSRPSNNAQNIDNRSNGVSIDTSILDRINEFTNRLKSVADTLAGLNAIPSEIRITGKHDINVVINGDSALNQLRPELQQLVMNEIKSSFQRLVNQNSPLPSDKLINPFDSNIG